MKKKYTNSIKFQLQTDTAQCMEANFTYRPIVNCLPAWFRFAQCLRRYRDSKEAFPHLVNAGKYSTTFLVVIFATLKSYYASDYESTFDNPYTICWLLSSLLASTYAYIWDIKMDWGLFDSNAGENKYLREEVVYSSTVSTLNRNVYLLKWFLTIVLFNPPIQAFYYFAIAEDFFLRYVWMLGFAMTELKFISGDLLTSILAPLEVFRRFVWNFFRLENEHLNNCGKFRAVRDISIAPIDSSDQNQILHMMDEQDGIINRYSKGQKPKIRKQKDPERKALLQPLHDSLNDLSIDMSGTKKVWTKSVLIYLL